VDSAATLELDRRFGIPGILRIVDGNGGLPKVAITGGDAAGEIYLHGAHVTSWRPRGAEEALFVSAESRWEQSRAIRGGVPICFPWFANKADDAHAPAHGLVRTIAWRLESIAHAADVVTVSMCTESNAAMKHWTPTDFHLLYRATFGRELKLELVVTNTGSQPIHFEEALHAYFRVGHIEQTSIQGLSGVDYLDKTDLDRKKTQTGPIVIAGETDRVYLNTKHAIDLEDQVLKRRVGIAKENSQTTVVWNPWIEKARALSDFGNDEWMRMVCIETANVAGSSVELAPGAQHAMQAIIRLDG
jgi:glucose-6-phosphate 1-epimerase